MSRKLRPLVSLSLLFVLAVGSSGQESKRDFYLRGALYFDWFGAKYEQSSLFHQLSTRLRLEMINRRGDGWTLLLDTRDRVRLSDNGGNQFVLYDARILFDKIDSPFFLSLGQMNLYDTAGIGQVLGGLVGYKIGRDLLLGGYGGLESSIYVDRLENNYQKYGVFARYQGSLGKRFSLSYNHIRYEGSTERQHIFAGLMLPLFKAFAFYGNLEYELAPNVQSEDRLSRVFLNARWDPVRMVDATAFYSSGRGLDYHRYLLERSQNPTLNDAELERFYYSSQYGLRLSLKPGRNLRFTVARMESEQKDMDIRNHSWRLAGSAGDIFRTGITLYGNYVWNRGEMSESDSFYTALSKDFGRVSWHISFANTFNGVRYDHRSETPEVIRLNDHKTMATQLFVPISRMFATSVEYEYFLQKDSNQHLVFIRLIVRN
jgi:hypothetical protein